ncbi:MAG: peptidoglycan editing factor PgeF [Epsilonproteobacteria bacterium]|nr:peptidoglycan editing factor PgeF [Campylobacterota bacterium]
MNKRRRLKDFSDISHTFTKRHSGVSLAPYSERNLAFHVGDDESHVLQNHAALACEMGYERERLVHMNQIHSADVYVLKEGDSFDTKPTCDALVTNIPQTPLMVMVADCSPTLFFDPVQKVIAVAHAGRAGAFKNIIAKTIEIMACEYGSKAQDIVVSIGPSIGECCYEVGEEIAKEADGLGLGYAITIREGRCHLDVNAILLRQLLACEIKKESIEVQNICTCCNTQDYFSYRGEGETGRFAGVIYLR